MHWTVLDHIMTPRHSSDIICGTLEVFSVYINFLHTASVWFPIRELALLLETVSICE